MYMGCIHRYTHTTVHNGSLCNIFEEKELFSPDNTIDTQYYMVRGRGDVMNKMAAIHGDLEKRTY